MLKELIKEAPTIEEAKAEIAAEIGVAIDDIKFEVLHEPQKKTLGLFGGSLAKVRGVYERLPSAIAFDYLNMMLSSFGMETPEIVLESEDDEGCLISITGDDIGVVIGRRGDTIDALQYLTGLVTNRHLNTYFRVTIDANEYRAKREQTLKGLAARRANDASRNGRKTSLEPMNPYERRIIHTAVQEVAGATSWSVGSASQRHVMIGPSDDNPVKNRSKRKPPSNRRRRPDQNQPQQQNTGKKYTSSSADKSVDTAYSEKGSIYDEDIQERPVRKFVARNSPLPDVDGATPPSKTKSETEDDFSLYGRIDL